MVTVEFLLITGPQVVKVKEYSFIQLNMEKIKAEVPQNVILGVPSKCNPCRDSLRTQNEAMHAHKAKIFFHSPFNTESRVIV